MFATIALLNKRSSGTVDIRWVVLRVVLEFLQLFRVVFNTTMVGWSINGDSWAFKAIKWIMIRCVPAACARRQRRFVAQCLFLLLAFLIHFIF